MGVLHGKGGGCKGRSVSKRKRQERQRKLARPLKGRYESLKAKEEKERRSRREILYGYDSVLVTTI